jgi:RNA polymerase sigma-70 factor, ECF subfamily
LSYLRITPTMPWPAGADMPFFGEEVRRPKAAPDGADSADVAILATKDPAREAARIAANQAMERYSRGEDPAFAELYDAIAPQLHHYLCRQTRDRTRADDLLQQTMLQIHRARGRFIAGAEVLPWAFAIARRLLIDSIRRRKNEAGHLSLDGAPPGRAPLDAAATDRPADEQLDSRRLAQVIDDQLERLPESHRVAFELIKKEGLSVKEAAEVLGTTVTAVKLRAHRAYVALRAALGSIVDHN